MLGTMSQMLRDMLRGLLEAQPGFAIVSDAQSDEELMEVLSNHSPDIVVVEAMQGALGYTAGLVFGGHSILTVLAVSVDSRKAVIYRVNAGEAVLRNVSAADLRQAVRGAVTTPATDPSHGLR
jgi:DNA-binding NarL/FixJ family response regulator